jgi:hypothetical protein
MGKERNNNDGISCAQKTLGVSCYLLRSAAVLFQLSIGFHHHVGHNQLLNSTHYLSQQEQKKKKKKKKLHVLMSLQYQMAADVLKRLAARKPLVRRRR